jgi:biotin operon repressor
MNIEEIVSKINNKEATRAEIGESLGMSNTSLSRRLKEAGYTYDQSAKKYFLTSSNPEIKEGNKPEKKEVTKKENNPSKKYAKKEIRMVEVQEERKLKKKVTYELDENMHWELRMLAFKKKRNVSELVEAAIKRYLSDEQ